MATYNAFTAGDPWAGRFNADAPTQTYEEFLAELAKRPGLLGADGTMQGSAIGGGPWDSWGKTPKQFYDEKMATKIMDGFSGFGDSMESNMVDPKYVNLDRTEDTRGDGLRMGLGMLAAPFAAQAMGFGGAGAGVGPAASAGGAAPFSFGTPAQIATGIDLGAVPTAAASGGGLGAMGGMGGMGGAAAGGGAAVGAGGAVGGGAAAGGGGLLSGVGSFLKENPMLTQLGGAALGALSAKDQNQTSTATKDPWAPAQQYLKDNLATNAAMQKHYQANPFSAEQKNAYQGLLNTIANNQANGNVLLGNASKFGQSQKGAIPQMAGLLTGTQAPIVDWAKYANIGLLGS